MPSRREFLKSAALISLAPATLGAQTRKPNVVVLLASGLPDLSLDTLHAPDLTALAAESVQFERSYTACPETGPSQASLITGKFPFACGVTRDGMTLPGDQRTLLDEFKDAGYRTGLFGDWRAGGVQQAGEARGALQFLKQNGMNLFFVLVAWPRADATAIDGSASRILQHIDDLQLKNNTIVVFTSDHGYGSGPLESSVRIPLMIRYGRLMPGYRTGVLASNVDIAPTLLRLCGIESAHSMQGSDWMKDQPQSIYCVGHLGTSNEWRMVVRGLDKLVVDHDENVTHLYNLGADPGETEDHAGDPSYELKRDELKALLNNWMRRTGDGMDPSGLKRRARVDLRTSARFRG